MVAWGELREKGAWSNYGHWPLLVGSAIEMRSPEARSTPAWHMWAAAMNPVQSCTPTAGSANHSISLWVHFGPTAGQRALQLPFPQLADECSMKLHSGKGSTFSHPVSCLNHHCRVNFMERPPEKAATGIGMEKAGSKGAPRPTLGIGAVMKEAVG